MIKYLKGFLLKRKTKKLETSLYKSIETQFYEIVEKFYVVDKNDRNNVFINGTKQKNNFECFNRKEGLHIFSFRHNDVENIYSLYAELKDDLPFFIEENIRLKIIKKFKVKNEILIVYNKSKKIEEINCSIVLIKSSDFLIRLNIKIDSDYKFKELFLFEFEPSKNKEIHFLDEKNSKDIINSTLKIILYKEMIKNFEINKLLPEMKVISVYDFNNKDFLNRLKLIELIDY